MVVLHYRQVNEFLLVYNSMNRATSDVRITSTRRTVSTNALNTRKENAERRNTGDDNGIDCT